MKPFVSVLLPVYNAARYLRAAVSSILSQSFNDFELIIINDGSTDQSLQILQELAAKDARIKVISRANTGYVVALNEALALAQGEFIARMDADDISLPARFDKQIAYLENNPDCVLVGSSVMLMDVDGSIIGPMADITFGHENIDQALLHRGWPIVHPAVMMRACAVRAAGGYIVDYCPNEDHALFLKLAEMGRLENLSEPLLYYRKHDESVSARNSGRIPQLVSKIIIEACWRRGIPVPREITHPQSKLPATIVDVERSWAWKAMKNNNIATARKYALSSLRRRPLSLDSWRLTYCAVRGY